MLRNLVPLAFCLHVLRAAEQSFSKVEPERTALEARQRWLKCIARRQIAYLATEYHTKAIAFLLTEGQSITLHSWLCLLPNQANLLNVRWRFLSLEGAATQFVEQNGNKYFVDQITKDLELNLVTKQDSGFYFANVDYNFDTAVYFVEVSETDHVDQVQHISEDSDFQVPEHTLPTRNLRVSLRLYDWSPCSRCDKVGIRYRLAICFVEPNNPKELITPVHYPIFDKFLAGLPCRSAFLPEDIKNLTEIKETKSVNLKSFCQIRCSAQDLNKDQDDDSNIIKLIREQKMFTAIKKRFLDVSRKLKSASTVAKSSIFQEQNKGVILNCPGKVSRGMLIIWKKNNTLLIADRLARSTQGRIAIDSAGRIRFRKVINSDANAYSCWIGGRLVGTVQLLVKDRFHPPTITETDTYANIVTYILTFIVMIYISWKIFRNRRSF